MKVLTSRGVPAVAWQDDGEQAVPFGCSRDRRQPCVARRDADLGSLGELWLVLIRVWCWTGEGSALLQLEDAVGPVILFEWETVTSLVASWELQCKGELLH